MSQRTVASYADESWFAEGEPETKPFIDDLIKLCLKHKLALVPTYDGRVSFHESMRVVPMDAPTLTYIREAGVCFEPS